MLPSRGLVGHAGVAQPGTPGLPQREQHALGLCLRVVQWCSGGCWMPCRWCSIEAMNLSSGRTGCLTCGCDVCSGVWAGDGGHARSALHRGHGLEQREDAAARGHRGLRRAAQPAPDPGQDGCGEGGPRQHEEGPHPGTFQLIQSPADAVTAIR